MKKVNITSSTIHWKGKKPLGSHEGTIVLKEGFFEMENEVITGGTFVIDMASMSSTDLEGETKGQLEGHLKSDDFFGVDNHPTATLVITDAKKTTSGYDMTGDLTIKGTTKSINFHMDVNGNTAKTALKIDRTKYNVKFGSKSFFENLGDKFVHDNFELDITLSI